MDIMRKKLFPLIAIAALLGACGDSSESAPSKTEEPESSYGTIDDLPNCSKNREGEVVVTENGNIVYGCQDGQWLEFGEAYDTEEDLPNCTKSKEKKRAFAMDKEEILVCADGEWVPEADLEDEEQDLDQDGDENEPSQEDVDENENSSSSAKSSKPLEQNSSSSEEEEVPDSSSSSVKDSSSSSKTVVTTSSASVTPPPSSNSVTPSSTSQQSTGLIKGSCGPLLSTITKNESTTWRFTNSGTIQPTTYMWVFTNGSSTISTATSPSITYATTGTGTATLVLDAGLETESSLSCSNVTIKSPEITGCTCSNTRMTTSNDLADNDPVKYTWRVSGCSSEGSEPLSYRWSGSASGSGSSVVASYTSKGSYTASVTVTNTDNSSKAVSCSSISVEDTDDPYVEMEWPQGSTLRLSTGSYYFSNCPTYGSGSSGSRTFTIQIRAGSSENCISWFDDPIVVEWYSQWYGCNGQIKITFPLYITIPAGEYMDLDYSCW